MQEPRRGSMMVDTAEPPMALIAQGAEARVWESTFLGRPCIIKERFPKAYRLPELDAKLTPKRVVQEVRCLSRCGRAGVCIPCIYLVDVAAHRIVMEKIQGRALKDFLRDSYDAQQGTYSPLSLQVVAQLGKAVASIHDAEMVHGDLTTSNFMVREGGSGPDGGVELVAIDFGLGYTKPLAEDKAVDLYVLERAFVSTHPNSQPLVDEVLRAYKAGSRRSSSVLQKLEDVRKRGRKRDMFG